MKYFLLVALLLNPLEVKAADYKKVSNILSYVTVSVQIGADSIHSFKSTDKKLAFKRQIIGTGITVAASELIKLVVHEQRPDKSDNKSFWSEHSAIAAVNQNWNYSYGIPLTLATASGRVIAKKHYIWDVAAGIGIGTLVERYVK